MVKVVTHISIPEQITYLFHLHKHNINQTPYFIQEK